MDPHQLEKLLSDAVKHAISCRNYYTTREHVLYQLLKTKEIKQVFADLNLPLDFVQSQLEKYFVQTLEHAPEDDSNSELGIMTDSAKEMTGQVVMHALSSNRPFPREVDFLIFLCSDTTSFACAIFKTIGLKSIDLMRWASEHPVSGHIVAIDSTKLTDLVNLERMLYEDFVAELDNGFIRSHHFLHNAHFKGANKHEVELRFRSKNRTDDRGWLVMDTVNYSILSAYRFTGTKTNRSERINSIMYAMAQVFGYSIDTWTRDYHVTYQKRQDGTFYPAEVRLKTFYSGKDGDLTKEQENFRDQTGGGFPNMEATLNLSPCEAPTAPPDQWIELPSTWYIKFTTDKERKKYIMLSNLPATFNLFDDEL